MIKKTQNAFKITLPFPISTNQIWISAKGRVFKNAKYRHFLKDVNDLVYESLLNGQNFKGDSDYFVQGRLNVSLTFYRKTNIRWDIDNFIKSTLDALMHAYVFQDDSQIDVLNVKRGSKQNKNYCCVEINTIKTNDDHTS